MRTSRKPVLPLLLILVTALLAAGPARAGEGSWTRFGPGNGEVTAFTADPELANTVYVAHHNGGVYKSVDGGVRWAGPLRALGKVQVGALGAFRGALFAFDRFGRFLRSDDHGVRWQTLHTGEAFRDLPLRQDPASLEGAELFFTPEAASSAGVYYLKLRFGVYRSTDEGRTWERILAGEPEIGAFAFDPTAPDTLYAGFYDQTFREERVPALVRSTDGGDTWAPVGAPPGGSFPPGGIHALTVLATRPATVLAVTVAPALLRSTDGGAAWQQAPFPKALTSQGFELAADPVDPRRVYLAWAFFGFHVSRDAGLTWEGADGVTGVPMPGAIDFDASGRWLYLAGALGVARQPYRVAPGTDFKVVYRPNLFETTQAVKIEFDPADPNRLLVTGDVLVASPDLGRSWALPGMAEPAARVLDLAFHPDDPATVYAGQSFGIARSRDGGRTWQGLTNAVREVQSLAVVDSRTLVAGSCGIDLSTDGGANWRKVFECDVPGNDEAQRFAQEIWVDPEDRRTLYAEVMQVGRGASSFANFLLRSTDAGRTWRRILNNSRAMALDPFAPAAPAAITAAKTDGSIVRSTDGGRSWQTIGRLPVRNPGLLLVVNDLRFDQAVPDTLYVAAEGGVLRSTDGGRTWRPINQGLESRFGAASVVRLMVHPTLAGYVYAATQDELFGARF